MRHTTTPSRACPRAGPCAWAQNRSRCPASPGWIGSGARARFHPDLPPAGTGSRSSSTTGATSWSISSAAATARPTCTARERSSRPTAARDRWRGWTRRSRCSITGRARLARVRYPSRWRLTIAMADLALEITPRLAAQELIVGTRVLGGRGARRRARRARVQTGIQRCPAVQPRPGGLAAAKKKKKKKKHKRAAEASPRLHQPAGLGFTLPQGAQVRAASLS